MAICDVCGNDKTDQTRDEMRVCDCCGKHCCHDCVGVVEGRHTLCVDCAKNTAPDPYDKSLNAVYRHLPCGCRVVGKGHLQSPFTVKLCEFHKNKNPREPKITDEGFELEAAGWANGRKLNVWIISRDGREYRQYAVLVKEFKDGKFVKSFEINCGDNWMQAHKIFNSIVLPATVSIKID